MKTQAFFKELSFFVCSAFALFVLSVSIVNAQAPGGTITAVDAKMGVITGKVNSTGQVFTFTLANKAQLGQVHVGQGIFVNLAKKQVSLDGKSPSGLIVTILPLLKKPGESSSASGNSSSSGSGSSANSGGSTTSSSPNPQPVSFSCGGTANPLSADTCSVSAASATTFGITMTCGASVTITGTIFPAGSDNWLVFAVPPSRANCADYSGRTPSTPIQASISSAPAGAIYFDVLQSPSTPVDAAYGPWPASTTGKAINIPVVVGLGLNSSPLQPGLYYIRIHSSRPSATGTWTLMMKG